MEIKATSTGRGRRRVKKERQTLHGVSCGSQAWPPVVSVKVFGSGGIQLTGSGWLTHLGAMFWESCGALWYSDDLSGPFIYLEE